MELALLFRHIATVVTDLDVGAVDDWRWTGPTEEFRAVAERLEAPELVGRAVGLASRGRRETHNRDVTDELDDYEDDVDQEEELVAELEAERDVSDADEVADVLAEPDDTPFDETRHAYHGATDDDSDVDVAELREAGALLDDPDRITTPRIATATAESLCRRDQAGGRWASTSTCTTTNSADGAVDQHNEAGGDVFELGGVAQLVGDRLFVERRGPHPVGPQFAPPGARFGVGEGPCRARRRDVDETGVRHPVREPPAGVGLGAVALGDAVVDLQPSIEAFVGRCPGEGGVVAARARRAARPGAGPGAPNSAAIGSPRCWSTWWAWTTSNDGGRRARERVDVAGAKRTLRTPCSRGPAVAWATTASAGSTPDALAPARRRARST